MYKEILPLLMTLLVLSCSSAPNGKVAADKTPPKNNRPSNEKVATNSIPSQSGSQRKATESPKVSSIDSLTPSKSNRAERDENKVKSEELLTRVEPSFDNKENLRTQKRKPAVERDDNKLASKAPKKIVPTGPSPNLMSPDKYNHPLKNSTNIVFMLGEDDVGLYLYGEGAISEGAYDKFIKYIAFYKSQGKDLKRLMLHSPGGILHEGLEIGRYIRENKWDTDSDKYMRCYSTCGFIFTAGIKKRLQAGAEVGFHRPYLPSQKHTVESIEDVYQKYMPYWNFVEGDAVLYEQFMKDFGRNDMFILNEKNITKYMEVELY